MAAIKILFLIYRLVIRTRGGNEESAPLLDGSIANTETILHFFYKITNERGTKTGFTYAHVKWFYGQSEHAYYLNYFIILILT